MPAEKPRLHLDFASPISPPPTYNPYTYCTSPTSPSYSPTSSYFPAHPNGNPHATPRRDSTSSSPSADPSSPTSPRTPVCQRIVMGAYVSTPEGNVDEMEGSLEVPGIVLTEPPRPATPRIPTPPAKHVVLLAPVSLPIPTPSSPPTPTRPSSPFARDLKSLSSSGGAPQFSPQFMAFLNPQPKRGRTGHDFKTLLLLSLVVLGGWHLWSTLSLGGVVEDAFEVL